MSIDPLAYLFSSAGHMAGTQDIWLDELVRLKVHEVSTSNPAWSNTGCSLSNLEIFLLRASMMLSQLATALAYGDHIDIYCESKLDEMENANGFSDTTLLDYLNKKHIFLKSIANRLKSSACDIRESNVVGSRQEINRQPQENLSPSKRFYESPHSMSMGSEPRVSHQALQPQRTPFYAQGLSSPSDDYEDNNMDSPHSDGSIRDDIDEMLQNLSSRGRGQYYCPYRNSCTKGGVMPDGQNVLFERNSTFRSHLEKHEKRYRCNLPGCTNKSGFARRDQLRRHQQTVVHQYQAGS